VPDGVVGALTMALALNTLLDSVESRCTNCCRDDTVLVLSPGESQCKTSQSQIAGFATGINPYEFIPVTPTVLFHMPHQQSGTVYR